MTSQAKNSSSKQKLRTSRPASLKGKSIRTAVPPLQRKARKSAAAFKNPPLLLAVYGAAQQFAKLSEEYAEATQGYRAKLYAFAARCYTLGVGFKKRLDVFARFKEDAFWDDARQKPKDDKVMKAVVTFAMKAKSKHLLSRVTKTASVLESLVAQEVEASEVAKRLKDGGGIEKMYAALSPNRNSSARVPDDLEMLVPGLTEDDGGDGGGDDDDTSEDIPAAEGDWFGKFADSDDNADVLDDHTGKSPAMTRAASDEPMIQAFGGVASPPKQPSIRALFDPNKHLLVDMSDSGVSIDEALNMGELRIVAIVEPVDNSDYWPAKAVSVTKVSPLASLRKKLRNEEAED